MKKHIIYIALIAIIIISCSKSNQKTTAPTTSSTTNNPTANPLTHQDSVMLGDWILDTHEQYYNGALIQTSPHTDPVNCHLKLLATVEPSTLTVQWKDCVNGLNCTQFAGYWRTNPGQLDLGTVYQILSISVTNLVIQGGSISAGSGGADKYYFHK